MKEFKKKLKEFFTTNVAIKLLAVGLAVLSVFLSNIK